MADSLAAWIALHSVPDMGPVTFRRLLSRFGTVERVLEEAGTDSMADVCRLEPSMAEGIRRARARLDWAQRTLEAITQQGGGVVRSTDPDYPRSLNDLPNPPPLLYQFGQWAPRDTRAVAIVGTTKPSARARDIARGFAMRFARLGVTVVSGFAQGIDSAAHLAALEAGGRTVLCLPHGIRRLKPRPDWPPLRDLFNQAVALSEQPVDAEWETQAALSRNRIIVALGRAVLVIAARPKGGTMSAFGHAVELGRPAFAIRYEEPEESGRGNAICIGRGAQPLDRFRDIERVMAVLDSEAK